jgi:hypothetical protein
LRRSREFENEEVIMILEPEGQEAGRDRGSCSVRKLIICRVLFPPNVIWVVKSRRMRWAGYIVRMEDTRNACKFSAVKPERKRPLCRHRNMW